MRERPILFSTPMVRAILSGAKTQTRRVVKPRKDRDIGCELAACELAGEVNGGDYRNAPYEPGSRLWVREAWTSTERHQGGEVFYRADHADSAGPTSGWRPSIHMPHWASRILLDVTDVRVERLRDISAADCWAEGIPHSPDVDPAHEYRELWESINGPGSWDANPWVFVVAFRRVA